MKTAVAVSAVAALASTAAAQGPPSGFPFASLPSCALSALSSARSACSSISDYSCLCGGSTISTLNSDVASSSCSDSDKENVYQAIAQLCANAGQTVTVTPEQTFSVTSGGSGGWPTGSGGWSSGGWGPFGPGGPDGGWGSWGSTGSWTTGPWTAWWNNGNCPSGAWTGWTQTTAWTDWSGCSASTTATSVVTTTVTTSGSTEVITTTAYGIQVAAKATSSGSSGSSGAGAVHVSSLTLGLSAAGAMGVLAAAILL